jgi:hypothetical protein
MAINVTEAKHVNTLLNWLLVRPDPDRNCLPSAAEAMKAAMALAERAKYGPGGGVSNGDIKDGWPKLIELIYGPSVGPAASRGLAAASDARLFEEQCRGQTPAASPAGAERGPGAGKPRVPGQALHD